MAGIDDYDYELMQKKDRYSFRFTVNFKKIYMMNTTLFEDNRERTEEYPKNILITMLEGIWAGSTILACFSNGVLFLVTLPFLFFYGMAFFSTYKTWKEYKYKKSTFWICSIIGCILAITIGILFQIYVLKM